MPEESFAVRMGAVALTGVAEEPVVAAGVRGAKLLPEARA